MDMDEILSQLFAERHEIKVPEKVVNVSEKIVHVRQRIVEVRADVKKVNNK